AGPQGARRAGGQGSRRVGIALAMATPRTPGGPPPAPPVQKLQVRYAKRGRLRFASTRGFQRALERALRRTGLPVAFSAGFHPHPRISYANAASTGTASEAEYVEISLTERVDPDTVRAALDDALPEGLDVLECREAGRGALADRLQASVWEVRFHDVDPRVVSDAVDRFLAVDRAEVTRMGKSGLRTFDTRGAVVAMRVIDAGCAILRVVARHTTPGVRPDDILSALRALGGLESPAPPLVTRLAQGPLQSESASVADPLAPDENVAGA
ncbi:MAG: TIGR03936 family radical SAM-associated protein, partial [Dermatophilaceae bacterium]